MAPDILQRNWIQLLAVSTTSCEISGESFYLQEPQFQGITLSNLLCFLILTSCDSVVHKQPRVAYANRVQIVLYISCKASLVTKEALTVCVWLGVLF